MSYWILKLMREYEETCRYYRVLWPFLKEIQALKAWKANVIIFDRPPWYVVRTTLKIAKLPPYLRDLPIKPRPDWMDDELFPMEPREYYEQKLRELGKAE